MDNKLLDEKEEKQQQEKDEKDEKEVLKHDEKVEERDALSSVVWAAILIWAGLVFLAFNTGWIERVFAGDLFPRILPHGMEVFEPGLWSIIMLGAGLILLMEVIIRAFVPNLKRHIGGSLILAAVFIGVGLGSFFGWDLVWPLILIAIGASILLGGFLRKH